MTEFNSQNEFGADAGYVADRGVTGEANSFGGNRDGGAFGDRFGEFDLHAGG